MFTAKPTTYKVASAPAYDGLARKPRNRRRQQRRKCGPLLRDGRRYGTTRHRALHEDSSAKDREDVFLAAIPASQESRRDAEPLLWTARLHAVSVRDSVRQCRAKPT